MTAFACGNRSAIFASAASSIRRTSGCASVGEMSRRSTGASPACRHGDPVSCPWQQVEASRRRSPVPVRASAPDRAQFWGYERGFVCEVSDRLEDLDRLLSTLPSELQRRLATTYGTIQFADSVARMAIHQVGIIRGNGKTTIAAIENTTYPAPPEPFGAILPQ